MTRLATWRMRGTAVPETAMMMALFLMLLYAIVEYAVLGFEQVSADGATFIGAHATVAEYSGPTASNLSYTQKVINSIFTSLGKATISSVPANGSYEADVAMTSSNGGISQLLPTSITATSRTIEPSASTSSTSSTVGNCVTGTIGLANGTVAQAAGPTVNLLQGTVGSTNGLFSVATDSNSNTAVALGTAPATNSLTLLGNISSQVTSTAKALQNLSATINVLGSVNVLGVSLSASVSAAIQPSVSAALNGTLTQAMLNGVGTTLGSTLGPLGPVVAATLNPLLYGTNSTGIAFTGVGVSGSVGATTPGLLSGGPNGGLLMGLNNAVTAVTALDAGAPKACT